MSKKFLEDRPKPPCKDEEEALSRLTLSLIPFVGPKKYFALLKIFGSAKEILKKKADELRPAIVIDDRFRLSWEKYRQDFLGEKEKERAEKTGIGITIAGDDDYPSGFWALPDPPPVIFYRGNLNQKEAAFSIAVIGTRNATPSNLVLTRDISKRLAESGGLVISGLARGIDTAAHEGALLGGKTWAVLGSGFGHLYPRENERLAKQIAEKGAVLTESPFDTPPSKMLFPKRNRLVAALASALFVVEAPLRSGALITVDWGEKLGKKILVLPGRPDTGQFAGSHQILREGRGQLVENSGDILKQWGIEEKKIERREVNLNEEEEKLLRVIGHREVGQEELLGTLTFPPGKIQALLMKLVLKKVLLEYPGKVYKKSFSL